MRELRPGTFTSCRRAAFALPAEQYDEGGTGGGGSEKSDPKKRDRSRRRKEKARDLNDNTGVNASRNKEERCLVPT